MVRPEVTADGQRIVSSAEESGTAPVDRPFRPDVEGLRAVAILLVVLYHASVPQVTGGYVGVDVFFVISGFVITGLLLRERSGTGGTSLLDFYARRCRRILPAATVTILITVLVVYFVLIVFSGNSTADDGRWAAAFLSNFHFSSIGTNYFSSSLPPSPLQNFWSLSVEEQFYIVYPTLFLIVAMVKSRLSLRARLTITLTVVIALSYWLSIVQTASNPTIAYFSPFTRAWELALGALVAVNTTWLRNLPPQLAAVASWAGVAAIAVAAFAFDADTSYPGSLVAVPVVGAALIVAGGAAIPRFGAESILGTLPFHWLGRRSYSLYLWHWPILIIAAEREGRTSLSLGESLLLVLVALAIACVSYTLIENPIRHLSVPSKTTVVAGVSLVAATVAGLTVVIAVGSETAPLIDRVTSAASLGIVLQNVARAPAITSVPKSIQPSLTQAPNDRGKLADGFLCNASYPTSKVSICALGDPKGSRTMVVLGDSHALMWLPAFDAVAIAYHWKLVMLGKPSCPAALLTVANPPGHGQPNGRFIACDQWHRSVVGWINQHHPDLLIATQTSSYDAPSSDSPPRQISDAATQHGLTELFSAITSPNTEKVLLGSTPIDTSTKALLIPECISANPHNVQACSLSTVKAVSPSYRQAEQAASRTSDARYIDPTPWFCSATCTGIIKNFVVYVDRSHITATYAQYLETVLGRSLPLKG